MLKSQGEQLPLKKVATAEDIAEVLVWFLESAHLITGESLIVDSGIHIGQLPPYSSGDNY
jgi:enoyl-[acyl-carrier-protein] reductase (NADH)